jgi:hypothetical protein
MSNITINGGVTVRGGVSAKPLTSSIFKLDAQNILTYDGDNPTAYALNSVASADTRTYVFGTDFAYGGVKINATSGVNYLGVGTTETTIKNAIEVGDVVYLGHSGSNFSAFKIAGAYQETIPGHEWGGYPVVETTFADATDINVGSIRIVKNYATLVGDVGFTSYLPHYFDLTPSGNYLQARDGVYFNSNDFTISAWVNINSYAAWSRVLDFGNGEGQDNVILSVSAETGGYPAFGTAANTTINSDTQIPLGSWVHLAATYSRGTAKLYMNGVQVAQGSQPVPTNVTRTHCYIGKSNWAADSYLDGVIGKVEIFNTAMSSNEVLADYEKYGTSYFLIQLLRSQIVDAADPSVLTTNGFIQPNPNDYPGFVIILQLDQVQQDYISSLPGGPTSFALFDSSWGVGSTDTYPNTAFVLIPLSSWEYVGLLPLASQENYSTYGGEWNFPADGITLVDWG